MESPLSQASVTYSEASPSKVHSFFDGFSDSGSTTPDGEEDKDDYDDFVDPAARQILLSQQHLLHTSCVAAQTSLQQAIGDCQPATEQARDSRVRSEERRVGTACSEKCRKRWSPY